MREGVRIDPQDSSTGRGRSRENRRKYKRVYLFTGENDADVMHNSASINLNVVHAAHGRNNKRIFYSSSACMYPEYNQLDPDNPNCAESSAGKTS